MVERFSYTSGTISIANGASVVTGILTAWSGHDWAGSEIYAYTGTGIQFVGVVAETDPRNTYVDLALPLVLPYEGPSIVSKPYILRDGPAIANGSTQAAIFSRFAALVEQSAGLVFDYADYVAGDIDLSLVPDNSMFLDYANTTIYQLRDGILEELFSLDTGTAAFSAHKNGVNQTGIADNTPTQITFGTEVFDTGGHFASNGWTPPAGKVILSGAAVISGTGLGGFPALYILKNGITLKQVYCVPSGTFGTFESITVIDEADGNDVYTLWISGDVSSGTVTVNGTIAETYFMGSMLSQQGPVGATGAAATIAVGDVDTLVPGAPATVDNVGTSGAAVLNFGIPQGDTGATGDTGPIGPQGNDGGFRFAFESAVSGDPGSGKFRFNNASFPSAISFAISETDAFGNALASFLASIDDSTSTNRCLVTIFKEGLAGEFFSFFITASGADQGAYRTYTINPIVGGGTISDNDNCRVFFSVIGNRGDTGPSGAGLASLQIVRALATANVTIASALENGDAIDGVTLATGDIVLLTGQTAPAENGPYTVVASGAASRTTGYTTYDSLPGVMFSVMEGTANADTLWQCKSDKGGTLGTTAITIEEFASGGGRESLIANRTYYVRTTGNDTTGDGLTTGTAFATLQKALNVAATIDFAGFTVTIDCNEAATFSGAASIPRMVGQNSVANLVISGAGSTTILTSSAAFAGTVNAQVPGAAVTVQNVQIQNADASGIGIRTRYGALCRLGAGVTFGACGWTCLWADSASSIETTGFTVNANSQYLFYAPGGTIGVSGTVALGTRAFSSMLANASVGGHIDSNGTTYTGTVTGKRFEVHSNAVINTYGAGLNHFPGTIAGTATGGGRYDGLTTDARMPLTADRTYYVRTDGSDTNTGLVDSAGGAFLTVQAAINAAAALDIGSFNVTIEVRDGTYTGANSVTGPWVGRGSVTINGQSAAGTIISTTSADCFTVRNGGRLIVTNLEMRTTTSGECLTAVTGSSISFSGVRFGTCAGLHTEANSGGLIQATGNYSIVGGALGHLHAPFEGTINISGRTVTISGTPNFSVYFAGAAGTGNILAVGCTFSGAATGPRCLIWKGAHLEIGGADPATYLPGNGVVFVTSGGTIDAQLGSDVREKITANRNYYVRTDGNNSNTGLTDSAGGAKLTVQGALDEVAKIDFNGFTVTVNVSVGTFSGSITIPVTVGQSNLEDLVINGQGSTTILTHNVGFSGTIVAQDPGAMAIVQNVQVQNSNANGQAARAAQYGALRIGAGFTIGNVGASGWGLFADKGGLLLSSNGGTVTADMDTFARAQSTGIIDIVGGTWAMGTRTFATTVKAITAGYIRSQGVTYTGTITAQRYNGEVNGVIDTGGGGANAIGGSTAGALATGAQYY
jgi:hypothetical protein